MKSAVVQAPRVWIPLGVPDDVVICIAMFHEQQWSCRTMGELRQIIATTDRL